MPVDLEQLLTDAAVDAPGVDVDALITAGLQRRRRRARVRGAVAGSLFVAAVVAAAALGRPGTRVDLAGSGTAPGWPLALRYEATNDESSTPPTHFIAEFAGNGWDDWIHVVSDPDPEQPATVQRWGPQRRDGWADVRTPSQAPPFGLLDAAAGAQLRPEGSEPETSQGSAPGPLLNPRFGTRPQPDPDRRIVDDVPALREAVAARLGLEADLLESVSVEPAACEMICGIQRYVWLPEAQLPLYVEEIGADGSRYEMRVTHLRLGVSPPANPLPLPPPLPPPASSEPTTRGLAYVDAYLEFELEKGTRIGFTVRNLGRSPSVTPRSFVLQRWSGQRWEDVKTLTAAGRPKTLRAGQRHEVEVRLPDDVVAGWHRLNVAEPGVPPVSIHQFHYAGDPNAVEQN